MMKSLISILLILSGTAVADAETDKIDGLISAVNGRAEVISSLSKDFVLQFVLPPQYSQCLFASFSESQVKNEYAHTFLLGEIDYLYKLGLTKENIIGLISYGHSISNIYYGSSVGKNIAQIDADDLTKLREFNKAIFYKNSCAEYTKEGTRKELKELIESTK